MCLKIDAHYAVTIDINKTLILASEKRCWPGCSDGQTHDFLRGDRCKQVHVKLCGFCGGHSSTGAGFFSEFFGFLLLIIIQPILRPHLSPPTSQNSVRTLLFS